VAAAGILGLVGSMVAAPPAALAQPETVVFSSDFESGTTGGWFGRGDASVDLSTAAASSGAASLLTTGRTATWNGPGRDLRDVLVADTTYQIEAQVRLADGDPASPVHLTMQRTPDGGDTAFERVASGVEVADGGWATLAGSYRFTSQTNSELQLYLESDDPVVSFYLDDVVITTSDLPSELLVATDFEDGTTQGWGPRGPDAQVAATDADANTGDWSLLTSGRTDTWNGPSYDITSLVEPGNTYGFSLWLKLAPDQDPATLRVSVQRDFADADSTFTTVIPNTQVTADEWVRFAGEWSPAGEAVATQLYAESAEALVDFYLDGFEMTAAVPPDIEDITPLKDVLADHFPIGAAIDARETAGASAELLTKHFSSITAENHMKPENIQPTEGEFTFEAADELVGFAEANGQRVYGHTLVWHSQTPEWFWQDENGDPLTSSPEHRQLALDRMQAHIQAIADHYGDRIWAWDVVNEVIDDSQDDFLRRSPWYEIIGPDYVAQAFHFAREAFGPDVKLFINDFNTEFPAKREAMFQLVSQLKADGVPVDGVGHQLHVSLTRPISWVDDSLTRFRELDVIQAVTELDVSISTSSQESLPAPPPERVVRQGYYYRDLFEVLRGHSDVLESVTAWGLHDGRSWLRTFPIDRPHEAPLFFDDQLQAKPAYYGVVDPAQLPHFPQALNTAGGTPEVDGERELVWDLLTETALRDDTGFQVRWDETNLYVLAEVTDETADAGDRIDIYVDEGGAARYAVGRDGTVDGGATAAVTGTGTGYRVEAALPLATPGALGREVGFDIRVTDGATGEQVSWSDQNHEQDTDTSRWGTLTLIGEVGHVDVPRTTAAPAVDGQVDPAWDSAATITTPVLVEGSAGGATAEVRLLWDEQRLYVLAQVADPQLDADSSNPWEQDSIEIFVDPGNTKSGAFKPEDGQYRINFENAQSISGDLDVIGDNLTSAAEVVDGGYLVEASVELTATPAEGSLIGLELQVNDATDGTRTAVHTWHDPTGQSFQDTSRWGVARLVAEPGPACDRTVTGRHLGTLTVAQGLTCLDGATVLGRVKVRPGASLVATGSTVLGTVTASGAAVVELVDNPLLGPVVVRGTTERLEVSGNLVLGLVTLTGNQTGDTPIVVSGNTIAGALACSGNEPPPVDGGVPSSVIGVKLGQCRTL
jgi:endo-1,4-beta-xylanase